MDIEEYLYRGKKMKNDKTSKYKKDWCKNLRTTMKQVGAKFALTNDGWKLGTCL